MLLIADGGSTKTDWRLVKRDGSIITSQCKGINPFHLTDNEIDIQLKNVCVDMDLSGLEEIIYYGAGISGKEASLKIQDALIRRFGSVSNIFVGDDLLGAARALFGNRDGIACILGTGSNSCLYKNGEISERIPALGYILGDEGSGTDLGKRFINALLKQTFPAELSEVIKRNENINMTNILNEVYRNPFAARNLAKYTMIIMKYIDNEHVRKIVEDAFDDFIEKNISKYTDFQHIEIGFVGSIAFHFKTTLEMIMEKRELTNVRYLSAPIDNLVAYHTHKWN